MFWRKLFTWCLLLALPMQGLAATGVGDCHGAEAPAAAMAVPMAFDHADASAAADTAPTPCHEPEASTCSACAACCGVAVLGAAVVPLRHPGAAGMPVAALPLPPASAWALPLERPPRSRLA